MKTKAQRSKAVFLTDQNETVLNLLCDALVMSQADLFRYVIIKAIKNPKSAEEEFDCPGLANKIKEATEISNKR